MTLKILALAATAGVLTMGPPRIGVRTDHLPAGVVAIVDAHYHVPEAEARVYATAYRNVGNRREERDVPLTRLTPERFQFARSWGNWPAAVVVGVEQGEHGKHGVSEALILIDASGKAVRADVAMTKPILGNPMPRRVSDSEIEEGYRQLSSR